ncbi:DUF4160 domain-containing protein [Cruoricaptor ignavus]|uniref:DUF4160 domain-containing protein n=1 Tax=Cruoricaptor ignavus TaxID=1118202 RepID=A0A7M1T161_9FLAO|nr:DUF4160 domain-containing protein [Cruoricaptor ignavus]QOR73578.1 DUF4160 domain-containing protein [Cruoricaptor ignavus]
MPEISRFYGIVIYMYLQDHNPPHFHARYEEYEIMIAIENFAVIKGKFPPKALSMVMEWAAIHREDLLKNWNNLNENNPASFEKIEPLK